MLGEKSLVPVNDGRLEEPRLGTEVRINQGFGHARPLGDRAILRTSAEGRLGRRVAAGSVPMLPLRYVHGLAVRPDSARRNAL
jgi:hypothetical protein